MTEQTLVFIKPDHVGLAEKILGELDAHAKRVRTAEIPTLPLDVIQAHYSVHRERPWFDYFTRALADRPVVLAVYEGEGVIQRIREAIGPTDPAKAPPETIRAKYSNDSLEQALNEDRPCRNVIHASDSPSEAEREMAVWKQYLCP
jgi:nucleoside-diphosphate kinase